MWFVPAYQVVDLHAVQSQRGTLIANVLDQGSYVSLISYNKGALWSKIPVPENSRYVSLTALVWYRVLLPFLEADCKFALEQHPQKSLRGLE